MIKQKQRGKHGADLTDNLSELKIILGLRNLNDTTEPGRKELSAKKVVIHPNWDRNFNVNYDGDIAIITLTEDVTFSRYIRPICIPDESVVSITSGQTSSWGFFDESQTVSEIPLRKVIDFFEHEECLDREPILIALIWRQSFCAGAKGHSFCAGSSGNGLYVQKNGKFYLRGMVTGGVGCRTPNLVVATDVLQYREFLEKNNI